MQKTEGKSIVVRIKKMPLLWIKCPKCNEILYADEVEKTNRCSSEDCEYLFPYPVAKALKVETLLRNPETTHRQLSKLILGLLNSISSHKKKAAFLNKTIGLVQENYKQRLAQRER